MRGGVGPAAPQPPTGPIQKLFRNGRRGGFGVGTAAADRRGVAVARVALGTGVGGGGALRGVAP
jgi:hypothetical protein